MLLQKIRERWERVGILKYHRNLWCMFQFSVGFPATLKCYRSHLKVKKLFLNVQKTRTYNFNLVKSLRRTCKWDFFFAKKWKLPKLFFKICLTIFRRYFILLTTLILRDTLTSSFSVSSRLHLTQLSNFLHSKLINVWLNTLNS